MMYERPTPFCRQMSGNHPDGHSLLAVLTRSTFAVRPDGSCVPSDVPLPLTVEPVFDDRNPELLLADTDLFPYKPYTDIVLLGHAYNRSGAPVVDVSLHMAEVDKVVRVIGERRAARTASGSIVFSAPSRFDRMPLRYDLAYGGVDTATERVRGNPYEELRPFVDPAIKLEASSPYRYPRNPVGRGFVVELNAGTLEELSLPNIEEPDDPLTPERLVAGVPTRWPTMPLPAGFAWLEHGCFPRSAYLGVVPDHEPSSAPIAEAARAFAPMDILDPKPVIEKFSFRFANGASHGLQVPYLRGDEEFELIGMHPGQERWRFRLPGNRPQIWTDGRNGKFNPTQPLVHAVIIEPDENRVGVVWCGAAPALRPYMPDELEAMPFRIDW
jgi:hypothetical protein